MGEKESNIPTEQTDPDSLANEQHLMPQAPATAEEWQVAVDAAHASLTLESLRVYGLIEAGPTVNSDRCYKLLDRGNENGFTPAPDAWKRFLTELIPQPLSNCCSAPVHTFKPRRRGRRPKDWGRRFCSECGKWDDDRPE